MAAVILEPKKIKSVTVSIFSPSICHEVMGWVQSQGWEDPLEKETATHCSILAWRSPWTGQSMRRRESGTTEQLSLLPSPVEVAGSAVGQTWFEGLIPTDKLGDPGNSISL